MRSINLAAGEELNPLIPHTSEIIVGFIAFSLLYIVLRRAVVPRFEKAFAERTDAIQGGMQRAEKAQQEAEAALKNYQSQLAEARGEAQSIREDARVQGAAIIEEMRAKAQEEAARITATAQAAIEAERQQAVKSLRNEVGALATELASKIVGEALDDQVRQSRIVDRFLEDLEKSK
jgi:F-type H+-transporting ATPase subunit b